jgi:hypothetical protein
LKIIIGLLALSIIAVCYFGFVPKETVIELKEEVKVYKLGDSLTKQEVESIISEYATGTKATQMSRTIFCESGYKNIQSNVVKNGIREDSWGLSQIHLPSHPTVTKEQALDPNFAIKFMSDNFYKVKWYGLNRVTDTCNPIYK